MPSTWSTSLRLNYQAPGDNLNAWGVVLNQQVFQRLEDAITKRVAFNLSGPKTLSTANGLEDEARCAFLDVTGGSGGVITAPAVEKWYIVRNGSAGDVTLTTGAGATALIYPGEVGLVLCDASNFRRIQFDRTSQAPTEPESIVNKAYADALAFNAVDLPGQAGNAGKFLGTDGATASWTRIDVAEVAGGAPSASPSFTGGMSLEGGSRLTPVQIEALDIDWSAGEMQTKTMTSSGEITFSGFTAGKAQVLMLKLTISASAVPTWPSEVTWDNGVAPALSNGVSLMGFVTFDGGESVQGVVVGEGFE